jgi:hypothetical protein
MSHSLETHPETLHQGQPVFLLGYVDREMQLPFVEPYIFIEARTGDSNGGETTRWYFRRANSSAQAVKTALENGDVLSLDLEGLATLVDWVGLVAELADRLEAQRHG